MYRMEWFYHVMVECVWYAEDAMSRATETVTLQAERTEQRLCSCSAVGMSWP